MIRKLSDLSQRELSLLFEVEYEILPILHSVGIKLNKAQIREEILNKPDQSLILVESNRGFVGLLRFIYEADSEEESIFITSLNIRRQTRTFLRVLYDCFKDKEFKILKSTVQLTNEASFSFHAKLGLKEIKRGKQAASFEITKARFLKNIEKYL